MSWYNFIIENKELIKLIYGLIIGIICAVIVVKTHKLYHLSLHEGIRYFRNAFLFYGIAFIIRYIFSGIGFFENIDPNYYSVIRILFEFFLIMGGFFLLYSLLWKRLRNPSKDIFSSLLNANIIIFYIMAFSIALLDYLWGVYYFMFFSQIILFGFAAVISYVNYLKKGKKGKFLKFYFVAMILSLAAWLLNAITALYFNWNQGVLINVYILNIVIFLLFLYGVMRITKKSRNI